MIRFDAPLEGIRVDTDRLDLAATRLAKAGSAEGGDQVDLSAELIALLVARNGVAANVKAAQAVDETSRTVLDLLG